MNNIDQQIAKDDLILKIYVGYKIFPIPLKKIIDMDGCLLKKEFHDFGNFPKPNFEGGYFYERNPKYFKYIYEFITGVSNSLIPKDLNQDKLINYYKELVYWGVFENEIQRDMICKYVSNTFSPDEKYKIKYSEEVQRFGNLVIEKLAILSKKSKIEPSLFFPVILSANLLNFGKDINPADFGEFILDNSQTISICTSLLYYLTEQVTGINIKISQDDTPDNIEQFYSTFSDDKFKNALGKLYENIKWSNLSIYETRLYFLRFYILY